MLTPNQILRIKIALRETERYIALEGPRSADLRPPAVQRLLDKHLAHRDVLQDYLARPEAWDWGVNTGFVEVQS